MKVALLFSILALSGCGSTIKKPLIWSFSKDGRTSYLLGTQHAGVPYFDLPDLVYQKLDEAQEVYTETDLAPLKGDQGRESLKRILVTYEKENSAKEMLSPLAWRFVEGKLRGVGSEKYWTALTPSGVMSILKRLPENITTVDRWTYQNWQPGWMMDPHIRAVAAEKHKDMGVLDSPTILNDLAPCLNEIARDAIEKYARGGTLKESEAETSAEDYRSGDEARACRESEFNEFEYRCLLSDRNKLWLPKIEAAASAKSIFVAAGACHMVTGKDSLLNLLRADGYTVTRLTLN